MAWLIASPQQRVPLATRCLLILPSSKIRSQSLYNPNPKLGLRPTPQIRCRGQTSRPSCKVIAHGSGMYGHHRMQNNTTSFLVFEPVMDPKDRNEFSRQT